MDTINKIRIEPITSKEELCFANVLGNKTFPKELIPTLNINNYINQSLSIGNGDDVGWTGYLQQNSFDYMLGGVVNTPSNAATLKPRFIYGNTPQAYSTKTISKAIIISGGSGYTSTPTVTITGDGSGAVGYAILNAGEVSEIRISQSGQNYTNALITISGGGGVGATATPYITSGQISSNLIYVEAGSIFSKLDPNGSYIGTEFYLKDEVLQLLPQVGDIPVYYSSSLHNQGNTPISTPQTIASKIFIIAPGKSKIGVWHSNIQIRYSVYPINGVSGNDNVTLRLAFEIGEDQSFTSNYSQSYCDFTLKSNTYKSTDFNPTSTAYYPLPLNVKQYVNMINNTASPKNFYFRATLQILSMSTPAQTQMVVQNSSEGINFVLYPSDSLLA